jgi:hypothetical protein
MKIVPADLRICLWYTSATRYHCAKLAWTNTLVRVVDDRILIMNVYNPSINIPASSILGKMVWVRCGA